MVFGLFVGVKLLELLWSGDGDLRGIAEGITLKSGSKLTFIRYLYYLRIK